MALTVICRAQQAVTSLRRKRAGHIPGRLKTLAAMLRPGLKPTKHVRSNLARFHNNTLAVYLHDLSAPGQGQIKIVEKNNRYSLKNFLFSPEVYFYRTLAPAVPGWDKVPRCYRWRAGWLTYQLFLEYVPGTHINLDRDFELVQLAITALQNEAPCYLKLNKPYNGLAYFKSPPAKRFRGDYPCYLARLAGEQNALSTRNADALKANLGRLEEQCRKLPITLNHIDLMPRNIIKNGEQAILIDWEKFTYAPAGFSQGNWLYTIFRKRRATDLPRFAGRWRDELAQQSANGQELESRLLSGLFCYICFVLEYLARPSKWPADDNRELKKTLLDSFIKSLQPLFEQNSSPEPSRFLDRMIQPTPD